MRLLSFRHLNYSYLIWLDRIVYIHFVVHSLVTSMPEMKLFQNIKFGLLKVRPIPYLSPEKVGWQCYSDELVISDSFCVVSYD